MAQFSFDTLGRVSRGASANAPISQRSIYSAGNPFVETAGPNAGVMIHKREVSSTGSVCRPALCEQNRGNVIATRIVQQNPNPPCQRKLAEEIQMILTVIRDKETDLQLAAIAAVA